MKKKIVIILHVAVCMLLSHIVSGQQLMINGDFEYADGTIPKLSPYPPNSGPIYLAPPWDNITGTCDVYHSSQSTFVVGVPRNGDGCGRFVAPKFGSSGANEYCYGVTNPLTAGATYVVSFWIRKDLPSERDVPVGVIISESIPQIQTSPFNSSHSPNMKITPLNTQYVKGSFCFTAQNSVTHYVSFGPWTGYGEETVGFYLDDVSVSPFPQGTPIPSVDISMPTTYCVTDQVIADGSGSIGNDGYVWEIYNYTNGFPKLSYSSGPQSGSPGTLDVSAILGNVSPGACYDVKLTMLGVCQSETTVNFCFVNPNIDFIGAGSALCENTPVDLNVTGDNGWTYDWSTGQSGVGLKTVTVTPSIGNATYSVTVTTPEGCTHTETVTLTLNSQNNLAPWMDGVDGSGEYTFYVNSENLFSYSFVSNFYNDHSNEFINYLVVYDGIPQNINHSITLPQSQSNGGQMSFNLYTGGLLGATLQPGVYPFTVLASDNNACEVASQTFTFNIVVLCDYCPMCVNYEDRTPAGITLPPETKAGDCINAGFTDPVETGQQSVLFQAGNTIDLGNFFSAGPGFQAVIEPSTCVTDCEDCCTDWTGFTYDPLDVYYILDPFDNDPTNDVFQVTDILHPYCAYNATGFRLIIWKDEQESNDKILDITRQANSCCHYSSPSPDNPISNASIWWDGGFAGGYLAGSHEYQVLLYDCSGNWTEITNDHYIVIPYGGGAMPIANQTEQSGMSQEELTTYNSILEERKSVESIITLYPNPSSDFISFSGLERIDYSGVQFFNESGQAISLKEKLSLQNSYDIHNFPNGTYYVRIYLTNGNYALKKFVKYD